MPHAPCKPSSATIFGASPDAFLAVADADAILTSQLEGAAKPHLVSNLHAIAPHSVSNPHLNLFSNPHPAIPRLIFNLHISSAADDADATPSILKTRPHVT
eukprot:1137669-Pelagomonas_calceolata.AAC.3